MVWTDGDLKIFAAGLAIGGEWNHPGGKLVFEPLLWNEEGQYDRFYIGFKKPILDFSFGQFFSSIKVFGMNGPIPVTGAKKIGPATAQVTAQLAGENHGILVAGSDCGWIAYSTGGKVPAFAGTFFVAGLDSYVDLAYCYDGAGWPDLFPSVADLGAVIPEEPYGHRKQEQTTLPLMQDISEFVTVSHYMMGV